MIDITSHPYLYFVLGLAILIGALSMLREKAASRIRNSRYWLIAFIGFPLLLGNAFKLMLPVLDPILPNVSEDVAIPVMFGVIFVLMLLAYARAMWQIRHPRH